MTNRLAPLPSWNAAIEGRKDLDTSRFSYKLLSGPANSYGLDVIAVNESPVVDEARMSIRLLYASGGEIDGVGDLLDVGGIDFSRHMNSPVSLFDHGKLVVLPIGTVRDPLTGEYRGEVDLVNKKAYDQVFFYQGKGLAGVQRDKEYDHAIFCAQLFDLWAQGYIRSGSIGYQVLSATRLEPNYSTGAPAGLHLHKVKKLESSVVVMPANQATVSKSLDGGTADIARKILCLGGLCGKPLNPFLKKSIEPFATQTTTTFGYQGKSMPIPKKDCGCGCGGTGACGKDGSRLSGVGIKPGQTEVPFTENLSKTNLPKQRYVAGDFLQSVKELRALYRKSSEVYSPQGGTKHKSQDEIVGDLNRLKEEQDEAEYKAMRTTRRIASQYLRRIPTKAMPADVPDAEYEVVGRKKPTTTHATHIRTTTEKPRDMGRYVEGQTPPPPRHVQYQTGVEPPPVRRKSLDALRKMYRQKSHILHVAAKDMKRCSEEAKRHGIKMEQVAELPEDLYEVKFTGSAKGLDLFLPDKSGRERASLSNGTLVNSPMGSEVETPDENAYPVREKGMPSDDITPEKACTIMKDGEVNGQPLSKKQQGMFGAACGRSKKNMGTKAMPVDTATTPPDETMPTEDETMGHPQGAVLPEEPFGAQVGRRAHADRVDLMREYHQYLEHCEDEGMRQLLTQLLTTMDEEMTAIEDYFANHERYSKLPPIEGAAPPPAEGGEYGGEEDMGNEAPEGEAMQAPTPDESAEGMSLSEEELKAQRGEKSLKNGRGKAVSKKTSKYRDYRKGPAAEGTDEGDEEFDHGEGEEGVSVASRTDIGEEEGQGGSGRGKPARSVAAKTDLGEEEDRKQPGKTGRRASPAGKTNLGEEEDDIVGEPDASVAKETDLGKEEHQYKPGRSGGVEDPDFEDRDYGIEVGHDPGFEEVTQKEHDKHKLQLLSHHENPIREAHSFLGKLSKKPAMDDSDRLESYHHHRTLDGITGELDGYFGAVNGKGIMSSIAGGAAGSLAGGAAAGPVGAALGGAAGGKLGDMAGEKGMIGNAARVVGRTAGTAIGGPAAGEALSRVSGAVHDVYDHVLGTDGKKKKSADRDDDFAALKIQDEAAGVPHLDANTSAPHQGSAAPGIDEIPQEHPHSPALKKVSAYLRGLSSMHPSDFNNDKRGEAMYHHEALNPMLEEFTRGFGEGTESVNSAATETEVEVGGMGEKDMEGDEGGDEGMGMEGKAVDSRGERADRTGATPAPVIRAKSGGIPTMHEATEDLRNTKPKQRDSSPPSHGLQRARAQQATQMENRGAAADAVASLRYAQEPYAATKIPAVPKQDMARAAAAPPPVAGQGQRRSAKIGKGMKSLDSETVAASLAAVEEANAQSFDEMRQLNDRIKKLYAAFSL